MSAPNPKALRRLDPIELFSSTRHHIGIYRCVTVTCRYQLPSGTSVPHGAHPIYPALTQLVTDHPMLRVGILGQDTNSATYAHIPQIDLRKHVEFRSVPGGEEYDRQISDIQAWCDDQFWQNIETQPPWRIIVVAPDVQNQQDSFEDIVFAYHHSLMDGTSGKKFHELLLAAFNTLPSSAPLSEDDYLLDFPTPPTLPEAQEDIIPFQNSAFFLLRTVWSELGPSFLKPAKPTIWGGELINFAHPHHTRVRAVDIPADIVSSMLKECRAHNTSITALLHALCFASFAARVKLESGLGFTASTPIALRPYMKSTANPATKDTFRTLISSMDHHFASSDIMPFLEQTADLDALIWKTAQRIKSELVARTSTLPADDTVSMAKYITDWFDHWAKKDGKPRDTTWEVSSIGAIDNSTTDGRKITRVLFTNGAMIAGPAVGVNVASIKGRVLTAGISWNEGVVSDELVEGLAGDLARLVRQLHETGKFKSQ